MKYIVYYKYKALRNIYYSVTMQISRKKSHKQIRVVGSKFDGRFPF